MANQLTLSLTIKAVAKPAIDAINSVKQAVGSVTAPAQQATQAARSMAQHGFAPAAASIGASVSNVTYSLNRVRPAAQGLGQDFARSATSATNHLARMRSEVAHVDRGVAGLAQRMRTSISASVAASSRQLSALSQRMAQTSKSFDANRSKMTALATSVVSGMAAKAIISPAISFESAMADVRKVVDFETPDGFKKLSNDLLTLTRELPLSAQELATIAASGGQLGVAEQDLKSFTQTIAKMSVAFDMSAGAAGDAMAKLANVYKIPIGEISKLGDAINELSNNSPAKAADIVDTLGRVGGVAKQFGLTENAAAALSNTFISLGKTPETAGTAINSMLTKMMTAEEGGKKFQQALGKIGLSAKQLKKNIAKDAQGALTDLLKRLGKLPKDKAMGILVNLFGKEYADDVAVIAGNTELLDKSLALLEEKDENGKLKYLGSMDKEFAARAATTENNLQLLKNSFHEISITAGAVILPMINALVDAIKPLVYQVIEWVKQHPNLVKYMALAAAGVASLIAGVTAFGLVASGASLGISKIIGAFGKTLKIIKVVYKAFLWLSRALMLNPIGLIITAIAAAAFLIWDNWAWLKDKFSGLGAWFGKLWDSLVTFFNSGTDNIVSTLMSWSPLSLIYDAFAGLLGWFGVELPESLFEAGKAIIKHFVEGFSKAWRIAKNLFKRIGAFFKTVFAVIGRAIDVLDLLVFSAWSRIVKFFNSGIGNISRTIINWSPLGLFYKAFAGVLNWFGVELPSSFADYAKGVINGFVRGFTAAFGFIKETVKGLGKFIADIFKVIFAPSQFIDFGKNIIQGLVDGIRAAWSLAKDQVTALGSGIKDWFKKQLNINSPSRVFKGFGSNIVQGLTIGIDHQAPRAKTATQVLAQQTIKGFEQQPSLPYQSLLATANKNTSANADSKGVVVHFNPTINVNGSGSDQTDLKQIIQQQLQMSERRFAELMRRYQDGFARRAY